MFTANGETIGSNLTTHLQKHPPPQSPWLAAKEKVREIGSKRRAWWDISGQKMEELYEQDNGWSVGEEKPPADSQQENGDP